VRIQTARSERDDSGRAVALWRGLVAGRWSLVEHFERDGRRYYLAHKNDPELAPDRALTLREKQVLVYAELGYSNKLIAYSLGLSSSTVATLLGKARRKVGMPTHEGSEQ
jgi:DNA-binding CsgD family transcriptional regulator